MKEEKTLSHEILCVYMVDFDTSNSKSEVSKSNSWKIYFFLENYDASERAVSQCFLYHQPLLFTLYQGRCYVILSNYQYNGVHCL